MKKYLIPCLVLAILLIGGCSSTETSVPTSTPTPKPTPTPAPTYTPTPTIKLYSAPPPMMIDPDKNYTAIIVTEKGNITLELFAKDVPITVNNFVFLAREGFYNNCTFHRVLPDYPNSIAQGGDPTGTGAGGPGYFIPNEITQHTHVTGAISMANAGPDTNGCQFFITYAPRHDLDGRYSVFGQLIEGMDVLQSLTPRDPTTHPSYKGTTIITIAIEESE